MRPLILTLLTICVLLIGCQDSTESDSSLKPFSITIDWVPSPEYYGFFVAKEQNLYRDAGLDVEINYGSGAPVVANQVATGSIYAGTTTSDNLLNQVARGGAFSKAVPILLFNPSVIASPSSKPVSTLNDLLGTRLGVNKQSSVYQQLRYLLANNSMREGSFSEVPIGWGGPAQLSSGQVDAILAYTTNAVVDLELAGNDISELFFSDYGVELYGLVLVFSNEDRLLASDVSNDDLNAFIEATKTGYKLGGSNPSLAADALTAAEPTLSKEKIIAAVNKISHLNETKAAKFSRLDEWAASSDQMQTARNEALKLYTED